MRRAARRGRHLTVANSRPCLVHRRVRSELRDLAHSGSSPSGGRAAVPGRSSTLAARTAATAFAFHASATVAAVADSEAESATAAAIRTFISDPPGSPVKGAAHYAAVRGFPRPGWSGVPAQGQTGRPGRVGTARPAAPGIRNDPRAAPRLVPGALVTLIQISVGTEAGRLVRGRISMSV
jgi:hypothetical protein